MRTIEVKYIPTNYDNKTSMVDLIKTMALIGLLCMGLLFFMYAIGWIMVLCARVVFG